MCDPVLVVVSKGGRQSPRRDRCAVPVCVVAVTLAPRREEFVPCVVGVRIRNAAKCFRQPVPVVVVGVRSGVGTGTRSCLTRQLVRVVVA